MEIIQLSEIIDEMGKRKIKPRYSYGILAYLVKPFRVLLAHPGGPFHSRTKPNWSIPKGGSHGSEDGWDAALREFNEETSIELPDKIKERDAINLGSTTQRGGKIVRIWAVRMENDDLSSFKSNTFLFTWPGYKPKEYPEIDEVRYFTLGEASKNLRPDQFIFIKRLVDDLKRGPSERE